MSNAEDCIHCGLCTRNCVFLQKYNMDLASFSEKKDLAYSCFLCGRCKEVCPKDIDGAAIALKMRRESVNKNRGELQDNSYKGLLWEKYPYKFSNYRKGKKKSVLFPGCNFPSFYPRTMKYLERLMKEHGIGIVYECCGKPVYELGMMENAICSVKYMEEKLKKQGVEELVLLCPNCFYFMRNKIDIPMVTIYEKLQELGEGRMVEQPDIPVYYPCPDRSEKRIFENIKPFLKGQSIDAFDKVQCCGLGGCAAAKEPELSALMAKSIGEKGQQEVYTYCASCVSKYRRKGFEHSYHILPLILGIDEKVPLGIGPFLNRAKRKLL